MSYMTIPFQLNSLGTGVATSKRIDYLSMSLLSFFNVSQLERPMNPDGSIINSFIFELGSDVEDTLQAYIEDFIERWFQNLTLEDFSVYNDNSGALRVKAQFKDKISQEITVSEIPLV